MKTTIEINDYEVKIEEMGGVITISVEKDGEVIEEVEVGGEEDFEDVEDSEEDMDDEDMDDEDMDDEDEDMDDEDEDMDDEEDFEDDEFSQSQGQSQAQGQAQKEAQLESFSSFIKKRR